MRRLIDRRESMHAYGIANTLFYKKIKAGLIPPPIKVTRMASRWPEDEHSEVIAAMIAGATENELRMLVKRLVAVRARKRNTPPKSGRPEL